MLVAAADGLGATSADGDDVAGADLDRAGRLTAPVAPRTDARTPGAAADGCDRAAADRHGSPVGAALVEAAADTGRSTSARRRDRATADRHRARARPGLAAADAGARIPTGRVHLASGDRDRTADRPGTAADARGSVPTDGGHPATGHDDRPTVRAQATADARRAVAAGSLERSVVDGDRAALRTASASDASTGVATDGGHAAAEDRQRPTGDTVVSPDAGTQATSDDIEHTEPTGCVADGQLRARGHLDCGVPRTDTADHEPVPVQVQAHGTAPDNETRAVGTLEVGVEHHRASVEERLHKSSPLCDRTHCTHVVNDPRTLRKACLHDLLPLRFAAPVADAP